MATIKEHNTSFSEEEKPERFLGRFIFTRRTVTYGHKTLQLSNVVKIEVKSFREVTKAKYHISKDNLFTALKAAGLGLLLIIVGNYYWTILQMVGVLVLLGGGGVVWYYFHERGKKKDEIYNYHGLFFECTSGKSEVLWSDKKEFVFELFDRITNSMNAEQVSSFIANFTENKFENTGDVIANNEGSTIVNRSEINS